MDPSIDYRARYESPAEVLADLLLTAVQKREILEEWRLDAERRQDSTAEGFDEGHTPNLSEVDRALGLLEALA